jgi:hypothetical protein
MVGSAIGAAVVLGIAGFVPDLPDPPPPPNVIRLDPTFVGCLFFLVGLVTGTPYGLFVGIALKWFAGQQVPSCGSTREGR